MTTGSDQIDLALVPDFRIGTLLVCPSACRITANGEDTRVEPRVMEVLVALWSGLGKTVTRDQLIEKCWSGRAVSDDAVTRIIAKVRQIGRASPHPHFVIATVPKVGFRLEFPVPGVEISSTPDRSAASPSNGLISGRLAAVGRILQTMPRSVVAGTIVMAACASILLALLWIRSAVQPVAAARVLVTPINVVQANPELHRLAAKSTTSIVESLAGAGLQTLMSTSAVSRGSASRQDLMLAGSADYDGSTYHMNITISVPESALVLWSGTFQRPATELRGLEQEVAFDMASLLGCTSKETNQSAGGISHVTMSALLNACESMIGWRSGRALESTQRLLALAPTLATSHAFRALALEDRAQQLDHLIKEARDLRENALSEARSALAIDQNCVAAHVALAKILASEPNFTASEHHFRQALAIDPDDSRALDQYGRFLQQVGRSGAALETIGRILTGPGRLIREAFLRAMNGDTAAAERLLEELELIRPSWVPGARYMVTTFWTKPQVGLAKLHAFARSEGARDIACIEAHLKTMIAPRSRPRPGLANACEQFAVDWKVRMLAQQGDIDGAYALMKVLPNSRSYYSFLFYPEMGAFRQDKRFMPLVEQLGLLRYWRETNQWPDFCAEPDLPYNCQAWRSKAAPH